MTFIFRSLAILLISSLTTSAFALECGKTLVLKTGQAQLEDYRNLPGLDVAHTFLKEKAKLVNSELNDSTYIFKLGDETRRGPNTTCTFVRIDTPLRVVLKETSKYFYWRVEADFPTTNDEMDLDLYDNQLVIRSGRIKRNARRKQVTVKNAVVQNRANYFYSCGFIDCTFEDDEYTDFATLERLQLRWNR